MCLQACPFWRFALGENRFGRSQAPTTSGNTFALITVTTKGTIASAAAAAGVLFGGVGYYEVTKVRAVQY